jgi:6-phosphogluconolactonase
MRSFALAVWLALFAFGMSSRAEELDVWFGTGGNNAEQPKGIWHATFDSESGKFSKANLAIELNGAGWITWHPTLPIMYSTANIKGKSSLCAIKVDEDKKLSIAKTVNINHGSCFLTTDKTGAILISAQYGGGTVVSVPIGEDGMLQDEVQEIQHQGGSRVVGNRQNSPHPHYAEIGPNNQFVYVPDLGMDQLVVYKLDLDSKKLVPTDKPVECVKGGGPRHMKIRAADPKNKLEDRSFAFVLNELAMSVSCFEVNGDGTMKLVHTEPTLSEEEKAGEVFNSASEIRIHPNGEFIYTANRGNDSISVFHVKTKSFSFARQQLVSVHGTWPRNFNLTPDGKWLLAAAAYTNSVSVFAINQDDGTLTFQGRPTFVPGAICVSVRK